MVDVNSNKFWYTFSIIVIIILGITVLIIQNLTDRNYELVDTKTMINNKILKYRSSHGSCYVELTNKRKILIPQSKNYDYSKPGISEIAGVGDSIYKKANNDTLLIIIDDKNYIFKIGAALNLPNSNDY
ncbi:hypothetical protein [Geofilum rhodophaeum]|uniref:hypothetical protein n=1 Tax=Geofilum rhodophaeum TaxID=1965019 RepID=UPI000B5263FE|nr:hypothetical protein [Geofilum rhodophaeum]